jgi:hypothetical protein
MGYFFRNLITVIVKGNSKAVPLHTMDVQGERRYSSCSLMTSALDGGEWSASLPSHTLPLGKGPLVTNGQESGWAPEPVWTQRLEKKSSCLCWGLNLNRPVIQSVDRQNVILFHVKLGVL